MQYKYESVQALEEKEIIVTYIVDKSNKKDILLMLRL
jgi:hypothetical protein